MMNSILNCTYCALIFAYCVYASASFQCKFSRLTAGLHQNTLTTLRSTSLGQQRVLHQPLYYSVTDEVTLNSIDSRSVKLRNDNFETDFLGMINFCLRSTDTALSGPSRSKLLNDVTNDVFKAMMIGYEPLVEAVLEKFPHYRKVLSRTACVLDKNERAFNKSLKSSSSNTAATGLATEGDVAVVATASSSTTTAATTTATAAGDGKAMQSQGPQIVSCDSDLEVALKYMDILEDLLVNGSSYGGVLGGIYDLGYKRLLTFLKDSGCKFYNPSSSDSTAVVSTAATAVTSTTTATAAVATTVESSTATAAAVGSSVSGFSLHCSPNINRPSPADRNICLSLLDQATAASQRHSKTRELNHLSNVAGRAILHGTKRERSFIAQCFDSFVVDFATRWTSGNVNEESCLYMKVLALLLRADLRTATAASTYYSMPPEPEYVTATDDNIVDSISAATASSATATAAAVKTNSQLPIKLDPEEIPIVSTPTTSASAAIVVEAATAATAATEVATIPNYRLFDNYQNAFYRVVEMCIFESTSMQQNLQQQQQIQNDEVFYNFLDWEQSLRRNLTMELWNQNPAELIGEWNLIDVPGARSIKPIMASDPSTFAKELLEEGITVDFKADGALAVKQSSSVGLKWQFKPGPAHLDTCEFYVQSKSKPDLVLKYVGFIDRGQRIESRLSKQPIRMTGRVISIVKGEAKGITFFKMVLRRE